MSGAGGPGAAVVTGGSSGIGAAVAAAQGAAGRRVVGWDLAPTAEVWCDVRDPAAVDAALERTRELVGVPTSWTFSAGRGHSATLLDADPAAWDAVAGVNAKGLWLCMRAAARAMIDVGVRGSMVALTSVSGSLADRGMGLYCASKAAADMLVRVAAVEWAEHGIRVNAVAPGVTETPMLGPVRPGGWTDGVIRRTPLGRLGAAADVAEAVLALHAAGWVTGQVLAADGGLSLHSPIDAYGERQRRAGSAEPAP